MTVTPPRLFGRLTVVLNVAVVLVRLEPRMVMIDPGVRLLS